MIPARWEPTQGAYRALVDDLAGSLDLHAGLAAIFGSTPDDLSAPDEDDLAGILHAGLAAIFGLTPDDLSAPDDHSPLAAQHQRLIGELTAAMSQVSERGLAAILTEHGPAATLAEELAATLNLEQGLAAALTGNPVLNPAAPIEPDRVQQPTLVDELARMVDALTVLYRAPASRRLQMRAGVVHRALRQGILALTDIHNVLSQVHPDPAAPLLTLQDTQVALDEQHQKLVHLAAILAATQPTPQERDDLDRSQTATPAGFLEPEALADAIDAFCSLQQDSPDYGLSRLQAMAIADLSASVDYLAAALNTDAAMLAASEQQDDALAASEEAVRLFRQLAESNPDAPLADALTTHAVMLANLGRQDEALAASEEAVWLFRQLAESNPDKSLPYLAAALTTHAEMLANLGRQDEALAASEEAARLLQQLAEFRRYADHGDVGAWRKLGRMREIADTAGADSWSYQVKFRSDTVETPERLSDQALVHGEADSVAASRSATGPLLAAATLIKQQASELNELRERIIQRQPIFAGERELAACRRTVIDLARGFEALWQVLSDFRGSDLHAVAGLTIENLDGVTWSDNTVELGATSWPDYLRETVDRHSVPVENNRGVYEIRFGTFAPIHS